VSRGPEELAPEEDPERPFETWLENYRASYFEIEALGRLGTKCREAAGDLIEEFLGGIEVPRTAKIRFARILTCLIYDSYLSGDNWDYKESE
jgi:hypothetical protein